MYYQVLKITAKTQFVGRNLFKNLVLDEETKNEFFSFDI